MDLTENEDGEYLYPWAGQADLPCILTSPTTKKKKRFLIDLKTGNEYEPQHRIQLISYKMLYDVKNPDEPIEEIADLYLKATWKKEPTYKLKMQKFDTDLWWYVFELWKATHKTKPNFPMKLPDSIKLIDEEKEENDGEK
jgi:hypothetical protein